MTTSEISHGLQVELPKRWPCRIFRRNVGKAVGYDTVEQAVKLLGKGNIVEAIKVLRSRPVLFGTEGEADFQGFVTMYGIACMFGIEIKTGRDRLSEQQKRWGDTLLKFGGIFLVAEDVDGALAEFGKQVERKRDEVCAVSGVGCAVPGDHRSRS